MPGDPSARNMPRRVPGASYSCVEPTRVASPSLLAWSDALGRDIGVARPPLGPGPVADVLAGNRLLPGSVPYAARYGGHQFGHWADQLGDGRAITLGELRGADGRVHELQLKGAGPTPYSRQADGRAVLRSSVREFLCSEAMHALGVPTTRALSLVTTGESVVRDMFYDGRPEAEPGAIVCRVAPSFVRFGSFEIHAAHGEVDLLRRLADHVIGTHFPDLGPTGARDTYLAWFEEVCRRTAVLAAHWTRVGFVHGVLNTDNMSILGLTIDYGPYGWLEGYDPAWTPNTTDAGGRRYRFGQQPNIALWNLARLGEALIPLVESVDDLHRGLEAYRDEFDRAYSSMLRDKLGLDALTFSGDDPLLQELFAMLEAAETDMTIFFRGLTRVPVGAEVPDEARLAPVRDAFYDEDDLAGPHGARVLAWLRAWATRVRDEGQPDATRVARMRAANPKYVLRNYLAQQAIDAAAAGDTSVVERLLRVLSRPYDDQPGEDDLAARRPEWARHRAGCSMLSCSS
ncbi:YdiU family protein [Luteitalea sp. TBR-22]|uniref:protein adenylyltransferase SelO n=1 Tax=Luteitalea sp. TBR-22 TaxID=2802971 RepID=UPI00351CEB2E